MDMTIHLFFFQY